MSEGCDLFIEGRPEGTLYIGIDENDNDSDALRDYVQTSDCEVSAVIHGGHDEISCPSPHSVSKNDFLDSDFKDSMSMAQSTFIEKTLSESFGVSSTSLCMADVTVLSNGSDHVTSPSSFSGHVKSPSSFCDLKDSQDSGAFCHEDTISNSDISSIRNRLILLQEVLDLETKDYKKCILDLESKNSILQGMFDRSQKQVTSLEKENEELKKDKVTFSEKLIENENLKMCIEKSQNEIKETLLENENLKLKLEAIEIGLKDQLESTKVKLQESNVENDILKKQFETSQEEMKQFLLQNEILEEKLAKSQDEKKQISLENESLNQQIEMAQKEMEIFEKRIENKNDFIEHFYSGLKKLFSMDKELHEYKIERSKIGLDSTFKLLSQRLLSMSDAKKICRDEQNKANSLKVENEILGRQIFQCQKEIDDLTGKIEFYQESVQTMTESNSLLVRNNTDLMEENEILKSEIQKYSNDKPSDIREFEDLKEKVQELRLDIVDKDSKISNLELHIKSCCSYYRKKAQDYKIELSDLKQQLKCLRRESDVRLSHNPFFPTKPPSPLKKSSEIAVQTEKSNSPSRVLSLGIVEKHKLKELEEVIVKLEKENTILKRLCVKRNETIKKLKSGE